jgi:hypothetical protein
MTRTRLLLWLILILPGLAWAEDDTGDAPWYQFEVLVFQRIAAGSGSTEHWPLDPGEPSRDNAVILSRGNAVVNNQAIPFIQLPAEEQQLADTWQTLRRSRDYRPLYLMAWRQQVTAPEQATPIYFSLPSDDGSGLPKLEGRVSVGLKRFLHLDTDLLLRLPATYEAGGQDGLSYPPAYLSYRMQETRRMRSGQLNYLDHPVLGVIAVAERYAPPVVEQTPPPAEPAPEPPVPENIPTPN